MINLLSDPSKMPCKGFNIPAMKFCPAAKLVMNLYRKAKKELSKLICSSCYACKGMYLFPNVRDSLQKKAEFVLQSIREDNGDTFVKEMCDQIEKAYFKKGEKKKLKNLNTDLFRVHDSGDLFNPAYIDCWVRIAKRFPTINFWVPTREHVREDQLPHLRKLAALGNVVVRPSALELDEPAPQVEGLDGGTAVYTDEAKAKADGHMICPATIHAHRLGKKGWKALPQKERAKLASCAGNNCTACFLKCSNRPKAYMAH